MNKKAKCELRVDNILFRSEIQVFECIISLSESHWIRNQETRVEVLDLWGVSAKIMWFTGKCLDAIIRTILNLCLL